MDVLIPVGPRDVEVAELCVRSVQRHVAGVGRIFLLCREDPGISGVTWVSEGVFPFSQADVARRIRNEQRAGWYLQQLMKLYFQRVVSEVNDRLLVADADTLFLRPCVFHQGGRPLFNYGDEYHAPYFEHMKRLHPDLVRSSPHSGIAHGMPLTRAWVDELFVMIESYLQAPLWQMFLQVISPAHRAGSGASEYEIYFHHCMRRHADEVILRRLNWRNVRGAADLAGDSPDFVSLHWHLRQEPVDQAFWRSRILGER